MKKPAGKGGRRRLADDDIDVWDHTAQSVEPLRKAKARFHPASERVEGAQVTSKSVAIEGPKVKAPKSAAALGKSSAVRIAAQPVAPTKSVAAPPITTFDRKKARKIRSGSIEIEARIDLHGMRQGEAHNALSAFIHRAQGRGQRWVLIITGKGKVSDRDDDAPFDMNQPRERGVLKRNVPRWLDEPELRGLVVSYTTAALQHGGEGALYVHLRKRG